MAKSICFYFQVHQPFRIREHQLRFPPENHDYFKGGTPQSNEEIFEKVSHKCYLPTTELLKELCDQYPNFHCAFSLSGVFVEQCENYKRPGEAVLEKFRALAETGKVEFLAETYYHSLSFLYSKAEFAKQVTMQRDKMLQHFNQKPQVFRNTELIYRDDLGEFVRLMGYKGVMAEGWANALPDENPNLLRHAHSIELGADDFAVAQAHSISEKPEDHMKVLTKNYKLSDDIAFRFSQTTRSEMPLTADTFAQWVDECPGDTVNLFMDFETFGEHQWEDTGIFEFLRHLPRACADRDIMFRTPSQTIDYFEAQNNYKATEFISWADEERDISAWLENDMQRNAFNEISRIEGKLFAHLQTKDEALKAAMADFRKLQTSDHLYYMSTKFWADGDVHTYFSPYENPYDAYINYMNTIHHLDWRIDLLLENQG
jgi:alpha-amylase